tara:strand:+ start:113321 stop:116407 length:3087 start_codon:yes stop_codon:yes gene_type:complete
MGFTDIFIRRPVLATVISLIMVVLGLMAFKYLPVRQFPLIPYAQVSIKASFPGASANVMQGFVTTPIQDTVSSLDDIDYMTGTSSENSSNITVNLFPGTDADTLVSQISSKIQQIKGSNLPSDMDDPTVQKGNPGSQGIMFLAFYSNQMSAEQIGDYVIRVLRPKFQAIPGVASVSNMGGRSYAMRLWLDPRLMAAKGVQPTDVKTAITNNNVLSTAGDLKGKWNTVSIQASTGLHSAAQFNNMVVKTMPDGSVVKLKDIGNAVLGASSYNNEVLVDNKPAVILEITNKTLANPLDVANGVNKILPLIIKQLPPSMHGEVIYDLSIFIKQSIRTVVHTLIEAAIIVIIVIFLSLGSLRTVIIPMITIPVSLVGALAIMMGLGYSINILTLLAMVLAIGLVVDDAIVVVENISRHLEEGMAPMQAAITGAREIASPVIVMTLTLAAVFFPVGFSGGISGILFTQFAFTLAGAVILSGVIALTLTPMMCSRLLNEKQLEKPFVKFVDRTFEKLANGYQRALRQVIEARVVVVIFAMAILCSCYFLYTTTQSELSPDEDQGAFFTKAEGPVNANIDYTINYMKQEASLYKKLPGVKTTVLINGQGGVSKSESIMVLKDREKREFSQMQLVNKANILGKTVPGLMNNAFNPPTLPGGDFGMPINFVLTSAADYPAIYQVAQELVEKGKNSGMFANIENQLKLNRPSLDVTINRDKAAQMGITSQQIADTLNVMMSSGHVTRFDMEGRNYYVIPQLYDQFRMNPQALDQIYVATVNANAQGNPQMVPISNFITAKRSIEPVNLPQFQRLNSATIDAQMAPGYTMSDGLNFLAETAKQIMPAGMTYDYTGESRQFMQEGNRMLITFMFALIVIFLVLSAQFESFRDPLIILISVPMSLFGALVPLNLGLGTLNIFTQIGLLTLVGLISKHGILIVQFANEAQEKEGLSVKEAVIKGATLRLRPILMTTAAMVFGVVPLIFSTEGLANSQRDIAMVIFCGMLIGTCFTLFVVPTMYTLIGHRRKPIEQLNHGANS